MENKENNNNSSNSLVFGRWQQTKIDWTDDRKRNEARPEVNLSSSSSPEAVESFLIILDGHLTLFDCRCNCCCCCRCICWCCCRCICWCCCRWLRWKLIFSDFFEPDVLPFSHLGLGPTFPRFFLLDFTELQLIRLRLGGWVAVCQTWHTLRRVQRPRAQVLAWNLVFHPYLPYISLLLASLPSYFIKFSEGTDLNNINSFSFSWKHPEEAGIEPRTSKSWTYCAKPWTPSPRVKSCLKNFSFTN